MTNQEKIAAIHRIRMELEALEIWSTTVGTAYPMNTQIANFLEYLDHLKGAVQTDMMKGK